MDRAYIDNHHVIARYLADQLPDADREAFESYFLDHPEVVQEMEAVVRLKVGLMQLRDSGELANLIRSEMKSFGADSPLRASADHPPQKYGARSTRPRCAHNLRIDVERHLALRFGSEHDKGEE